MAYECLWGAELNGMGEQLEQAKAQQAWAEQTLIDEHNSSRAEVARRAADIQDLRSKLDAHNQTLTRQLTDAKAEVLHPSVSVYVCPRVLWTSRTSGAIWTHSIRPSGASSLKSRLKCCLPLS